MKNLKLTSIVFSLMAIVIIFMSSCEQNELTPIVSDENQDVLPSTEFINQLDAADKAPIPSNFKIPELTEEIKTNISSRSDCTLQYGAWNHTRTLGWIFTFDPYTYWFYSNRYKDYIIIENHDDICDGGGTMFGSNHPICYRSGTFYQFDEGGRVYHLNGNSWSNFICGTCDNNDYTSRFMELISRYNILEGSAASSGITEYYIDLTDFRDLVQTDAPLDIKNTDAFLVRLRQNDCPVKFFGRDVASDVAGNVLYGFIGYLFWKNRYPNYPDCNRFLGAAAGLAQGIHDQVIPGPFAPGLLLDPTDWSYLTSFDQWCDTYAVYFGADMARNHGANITFDQFVDGVHSPNTWLYEPNYNCPATSSPTGW